MPTGSVDQCPENRNHAAKGNPTPTFSRDVARAGICVWHAGEWSALAQSTSVEHLDELWSAEWRREERRARTGSVRGSNEESLGLHCTISARVAFALQTHHRRCKRWLYTRRRAASKSRQMLATSAKGARPAGSPVNGSHADFGSSFCATAPHPPKRNYRRLRRGQMILRPRTDRCRDRGPVCGSLHFFRIHQTEEVMLRALNGSSCPIRKCR